MRYEEPEMLELGSVEELTLGGEIWQSIDRWTGLRGWYWGTDDAVDED